MFQIADEVQHQYRSVSVSVPQPVWTVAASPLRRVNPVGNW